MSISSVNNISLFIQSRIIKKNPIEISGTRMNAIKFLNGMAVLIGSGGRYPYFSISRQAAESNEAYGNFLGICNMASFAVVYSWSLLNIINNTLRTMSPEEEALLSTSQKTSTKVAFVVIPFLMGTASLLPQAFFAYEYNGEQLFYPIMLLVCDFGLPVYSLNLLSNRILKKRMLSDFENEFISARELLVAKAETAKKALYMLDSSSRVDYVNNLISKDSSIQDFYGFIEALQSRVEPRKYSTCEKITKFVSKWLIGVPTAIANVALLYKGTYSFMEELSDDPYLNHSISTVVSGILVEVLFKSIINSSVNIGDKVFNLCSQQNTTTIVKTLKPNIGLGIELVGTLIAFFSYGPSFALARDNFGDEQLGKFMQGAVPSGVILLILNCLGDIIEDGIKAVVTKKGSREQRDLVFLASELSKLQVLYRESPLVELLKHIKDLPVNIREEIGEKIENLQQKIDRVENAYNRRQSIRQPLLIEEISIES